MMPTYDPNLRPWPADAVERWPLDRIKPYPRNARLHSPEQVEKIAASMRTFGVTAPVLVDEDGTLIFGHGRRAAAELLAAGGLVVDGRPLPPAPAFAALPVSIARGWTEPEKNAYRIADNQLGLASRWDDVLLREGFQELKGLGFDVNLLGFDAGQLTALDLDFVLGENEPGRHWQNMPEFQAMAGNAHRVIRILFADAAAVARFAQLIGQPIEAGDQYLWFPERPHETRADKRFVSTAAEPPP